MHGSQGLLEKLASLGINMIPQGASLAGGAFGGPAGAIAGGALGSGLQQLLQPQQSQFGGSGMVVGPGMPMQMPQEQDRLQKALGSLAGQGVMGAANALAPSGIEPGEEWLGLFSKLMQSVPRDEILRWLESRGKSQIEGAV